MEQDLECLSAKLLSFDTNIEAYINNIDNRDDPSSSSQLSETYKHDIMKGDFNSSGTSLPSLLKVQDICDVLISDNEGFQSHHASLQLQDLKYLSSVIGKFDGENSRYQRFKFKFCTIAESTSLTVADKGLLLYMSLEDSVIDLVGKVTEEGRISYQKQPRNEFNFYLPH